MPFRSSPSLVTLVFSVTSLTSIHTKPIGIWRNTGIWLVISNLDVLAGKETTSKEISQNQGIWGLGNGDSPPQLVCGFAFFNFNFIFYFYFCQNAVF